MLKQLLLAGSALAFLAATVAIVPVGTANAGMMGDTMKCRQMAKDKYPNDAKMRKMMRSLQGAHEDDEEAGQDVTWS